MNTIVNRQIANLLKEKGFDVPCLNYYSDLNLFTREYRDWNNQTIGDTPMHKRNAGYCSAPTIAEVVMWLYEKHGIWISIDMVIDMVYDEDESLENRTGFWYCIREKKLDDFSITSDDFTTPTEAYERAIEYTLNKLI